MTNLLNITSKSDIIGVITSSLCFLHCLVAPFIFVAQVGFSKESESHPWWWTAVDIVFIVISFFAVYWSAKNTSKRQIRYAFWSFWLLLTLIIVNEKLEIIDLAEEVIYLLTIGLISLHFFNHRYCRCESDNCCSNINR